MIQESGQKVENVIKLTGKATIEEPLDLSAGYTIKIDGECTSITEADLYNGQHIKYFKFKPIKAEITDEKGKIIKVKDTRRYSEKLRRMITWLWEQNENDPDDVETAYERTMNWILSDVEFPYRKALEKGKKI